MQTSNIAMSLHFIINIKNVKNLHTLVRKIHGIKRDKEMK